MKPKIVRASNQDVVRARELRREMTIPEKLLWGRLRERRCQGLRFRRQQPIGKYVVDFYCDVAKTVIELDGVSHVGQMERDEERERFLKGMGVRIIRFTNDEVLANLGEVVEEIGRVCGKE